MVSVIVKDIEAALSKIIELQNYYVSKVCSKCINPCCRRVGYLYSDKDILFLRLSGKNPVRKIRGHRRKGCIFLGPEGCLLDALSRPFICHRYICPELEKTIKEDNPEILYALEDRFKLVDEMRGRMWSEYLDSVMRAGTEGRI
ncbi:hypothetical protein ACFL2O_03055 [Thermodesulfobacteriota bacterium]